MAGRAAHPQLTMFGLVHALLEHFQSLLLSDTFIPVLVHRAQRDVDSEALGGVGNASFGTIKIDEVARSGMLGN